MSPEIFNGNNAVYEHGTVFGLPSIIRAYLRISFPCGRLFFVIPANAGIQ